MPAIPCHIEGCTFTTPDVDNAVAAVMLGHHLSSAHPAPVGMKAPTIPPPTISGNVYEDQWDCFTREWAVYKGTVAITADKLPVYLLACCSAELKSSVERANPTIMSKTESEVMAAIKRHAVVSVAASVLRTELLAMKQDHGETVLAFASRALGKARNCKLTVKCPHDASVDYSEEMVKHVVLAGMYDDEIKRKVLSTANIDSKTLNETITIIETEEMALRSINAGVPSNTTHAGATTDKKQISPTDKRLQIKGKCSSCQEEFFKHRVKKVGKEEVLMTDRLCKICWQAKRSKKGRPGQSQSQGETAESGGISKADEFPYLAAVEAVDSTHSARELLAAHSKRDVSVPMPHHIFDGTRDWM